MHTSNCFVCTNTLHAYGWDRKSTNGFSWVFWTRLNCCFIWLPIIAVLMNCRFWSFLQDTKSHSVETEGSWMMWRRKTNISVIHPWLTCYWRDIKPVYHTMNPNCTVLLLLRPDLFPDSTFCLFLTFGVMFHHQGMNLWPNANPAYKGKKFSMTDFGLMWLNEQGSQPVQNNSVLDGRSIR